MLIHVQLQSIENYFLNIDWKAVVQKIEEEVKTKIKLKAIRSNSESLASASRIQVQNYMHPANIQGSLLGRKFRFETRRSTHCNF